MKRIAKRIISLMLAAVMVFGAAPLAGFVGLELPSLSSLFRVQAEEVATSGTCGDNLTWTFNESTRTLNITGTGNMYFYLDGNRTPWNEFQTDIISVIIGYGVTSIGGRAFHEACSLESIILPDSLNKISDQAFFGCGKLAKIIIPDSVTRIEGQAFQGCKSLKSIDIPCGVSDIGYHTFSGCTSLEKITIPDSVTNIGQSAFWNCTSLEDIIIPDSVTSIDSSAFDNTGIYNNQDNWSNGVLYIDNCLIKANSSVPNLYIIKEGTRKIAMYAFSDCEDIRSITVPGSVVSIGKNTFSKCANVENISIQDGVTSIDYQSFYACTNLESVTIPESVTSIGEKAFANCTNLKSITVPNSMTSINKGTFSGCTSLATVTIGDMLTEIRNDAFFNCTGLTDVYYSGSQEQWEEITILYHNENLKGATIHYRGTSSSDTSTDHVLNLISVTPANNATAVSYTDSVVLTFNKNIKTYLLSGQSETDTEIAIRSYTTDEPIYSTYEMNPESFPVESGNQLIIPFALLKMIPGEKYYVYISPNSIRAADNFFGEKFEGITDKDAYTFSNFTPSITEGYSLDLFSANGNIEVKPGEEISVAAILSLDGIPDNTNGITFTISDTSIAEITKIDKQSDRIVVFIKGNQQGITTLSVNADNANRNISAPVFVNDDKAVYYPSDLYKFDEDNPLITQGMFLTDFDFEENDNGETSAKFNVYNADCCTGIVDVYDSKGVCVESVLIDMFDGDYPTDIFDHMEYAGELIYNVFEIFDPDVIIQKAYTEKTSVSINIPHNGYITVTKDVAASDALLVYDVVTLSLEAISCASDVIDHFSAEEEEDVKKAVAEKILVKVSETWLKKIRNSFIDYSTQNKSTDDFIYALFSDIDSALAESGDDFIDILTETAAETLPDVVFDDLKKHILKDFGIDIVDKIFYKSVKVVKWATIFNYISVYLMDESLVIYASQDGETKYSNGAKAQLSEDDENIVFHSVMITTGEKADALNAINEDTKLFEISLIKNGKVYDPYKTVAVYLPIPEGWDTENLTVYHLTDDYKTREKLDVVIENGYVKFETEGFSPFILANGELSFIDSISIKTPSTTTINYGDSLVLHADIANIPNGTKIEWSVNGDGVSISPSEDGKTCAVTSKKSGDVTVSVKLVDNNGKVVKSLAGNELISEQKLKSNAGFFQKIISFFKNLFGINRTILQAFKNII